jgi:hypothetical protein
MRLGFAALLAAWLTCGCERAPTETREPPRQPREIIPPSERPPVYTFAPGLERDYPEAAAFVRSFLDVCLAGDYTAYRGLVARSRQPEPRERFEAIYRAMRTVRIDEIEPIVLRDLPSPAFRVVTAVEFDPEARVALRGANRDIAILIFREGDDWRMLPAPAGLQPGDEPTDAEDDSLVASPVVDYPWEADGDF